MRSQRLEMIKGVRFFDLLTQFGLNASQSCLEFGLDFWRKAFLLDDFSRDLGNIGAAKKILNTCRYLNYENKVL